eukprot:TRINITY_DN6417_c0_g6_i1.p1 TRINITY_DN6417_c0_g6~~TRINITY_DN6417_c0_g6_i1.p1  ORF type:complete len:323 (+),score=26.09 TRINITY_DN6417_c0_g6_i1:154-1122(+)
MRSIHTRSRVRKEISITVANEVHGLHNSSRVSRCIPSNQRSVPQDYEEWFKKLPIKKKHGFENEVMETSKTECTICDQTNLLVANRENIPLNTQPTSENLNESDIELLPSQVKCLLIHNGKQAEDVVESSVEETCRAGKIPASYCKRKDTNCFKRAFLRRNYSTVEKPLKNIAESVRMEGCLEMYSESLLGSWGERYCVLRESSFACYESKTSLKMKCCVNFSVVDCVLMLESGREPFKFQYLLPSPSRLRLPAFGKSLTFRSKSSDAIVKWIHEIRSTIIEHSTPKSIPTAKYWEVKLCSHLYSIIIWKNMRCASWLCVET